MTLVETLQQLLIQQPNIQLAYLFGSVAQGTATYESDLGIAIQTSQPLEPPDYIRLVEELAIVTGRAVDLIDLSKAGSRHSERYAERYSIVRGRHIAR